MVRQKPALQLEYVVSKNVSDGILETIYAEADVALGINITEVPARVAWPDSILGNGLGEFSEVSS